MVWLPNRTLVEEMMTTPIVDDVVKQMAGLPQELQWRVLEFTRSLAISTPRGVSGKELLRFAGAISANDTVLMREAIEQGCEQIDAQKTICG